MDNEKSKVCKFKESKFATVLFWIFAMIPFHVTDSILRFGINFIPLSEVKYCAIPFLFNILWVFGIVYFCRNILPCKIGRVVYSIFYIFFGVLFFVNYIYFCFFGQYMWFKSIFLAGEGMDYAKDAFAYIDGKVIGIIILYIFFFAVVHFLWRKPKNKKLYKKIIVSVIPFLLLFGLEYGIQRETRVLKDNGAWEVWERPLLVYDTFTDANKSLNVCGFYQYTFKSIYREFFKDDVYTEEEKAKCDAFFAQKNSELKNEMTGILKGKNVIFVLLESIDDWLITQKYTPTLKYMMDNGINFENHFMPNVGSGYTFNAEFAMNTGYYCPSDSSSASVYTSNSFPYAMANLFKKQGYNANSFHFNDKTFYNRKNMHTRFGFDEYYRLMDYMPIEKCVQDGEVPLVDEIYEKMTEGNFFSFYISYSCHLPYDNLDNKLKGAIEKYPELIDEELDEESRNIFLLAHDTDEFFRILIERLKEDGLYENTVIIGCADHYAYGFKDKEKLKEYTSTKGTEIMEKVPFFIFTPGMKHISVKKVTSAIDILPTISNLFDLGGRDYIGNDAFDPDYNGLVYFPNGSWYDGKYFYTRGDDVSSFSPERQEYISQTNKLILHYSQINDYVVASDYFKQAE